MQPGAAIAVLVAVRAAWVPAQRPGLSHKVRLLACRLGQEAAQGGVDVEQLQADMSRLRSQ